MPIKAGKSTMHSGRRKFIISCNSLTILIKYQKMARCPWF
jgi:hypothetical protein